MKVYVHAWEYCSPGPIAGGSGFDWFFTEEAARREYDYDIADDTARPDRAHWAHFYFEYEVPPGTNLDEITDKIDADIGWHCACAVTRHVGVEVERYWRENHFNMGQPAKLRSRE